MGNKKPSPPNHMAIQWHDYVQQEGEQSILTASLTAKASVVGRTGLMLLACGTGAWRVRSSMNAMAAKLGKETRPDIHLGICGEHGGDPSSVEFCHRTGLDYVSCSPFRVPIARLAAAQAAIKEM